MIRIVSRSCLSFFILFQFYFLPCQGQEGKTIKFDLHAMLADHSLKAVNRVASPLTEGSSINGIHLNEVSGQGIAWLGEGQFLNGVIEFDVRGKDEYQKSFVGIAFHGVNDTTFDAVYLRPFNFRTTDTTRKKHEVQYISMPGHDWYVLRDGFPGKYEQPIDPSPDPNDWVHVRIVVKGNRISVYINHNKNPSLVVKQLVNLGKGKIGLWAGNTSGGDWANVMVWR